MPCDSTMIVNLVNNVKSRVFHRYSDERPKEKNLTTGKEEAATGKEKIKKRDRLERELRPNATGFPPTLYELSMGIFNVPWC